MNELVATRDLKKSFRLGGEVIPVLKGIDLQIERGEFVSIVGPSGVGKSTLLYLLGALDRPTSGEIIFEGSSLSQFSDEELALFRNRKIGFIFQFHHLLPELNALENTMIPALIGRMSREEAQREAISILEGLNLLPRLHHRPGELSGGEQQRVAVARALVTSPAVILADEPTGNLDGESSKNIFELLRRLNQERKFTIVMVTHNEKLASATDRTIKMANGCVAHSK